MGKTKLIILIVLIMIFGCEKSRQSVSINASDDFDHDSLEMFNRINTAFPRLTLDEKYVNRVIEVNKFGVKIYVFTHVAYGDYYKLVLISNGKGSDNRRKSYEIKSKYSELKYLNTSQSIIQDWQSWISQKDICEFDSYVYGLILLQLSDDYLLEGVFRKIAVLPDCLAYLRSDEDLDSFVEYLTSPDYFLNEMYLEKENFINSFQFERAMFQFVNNTRALSCKVKTDLNRKYGYKLHSISEFKGKVKFPDETMVINNLELDFIIVNDSQCVIHSFQDSLNTYYPAKLVFAMTNRY